MAENGAGIIEVATIGRTPKNVLTQIVARIVHVHGRPCADLRTFADTAAGPRPTKAGICLSLEGVPGLVALVQKLGKAAKAAMPPDPEKSTTRPPSEESDGDGGAEAEGEGQ